MFDKDFKKWFDIHFFEDMLGDDGGRFGLEDLQKAFKAGESIGYERALKDEYQYELEGEA